MDMEQSVEEAASAVGASREAGPGTQRGYAAWSETELRTALESGGTIFERLVGEENDVIGLLSYSFAMQNKRDWLAGFVTVKGRTPNTDEIEAYEIGELIDRRLTTYRKLAENTLSGNPIWASTGTTPVSELLPQVPTTGPFPGEAPSAPPGPVMPQRQPSRFSAKLAVVGVLALALIAAYVAYHVMGTTSV